MVILEEEQLLEGSIRGLLGGWTRFILDPDAEYTDVCVQLPHLSWTLLIGHLSVALRLQLKILNCIKILDYICMYNT